MVAAVSTLAGVAFSIPAGMLSDRFGRKTMLIGVSWRCRRYFICIDLFGLSGGWGLCSVYFRIGTIMDVGHSAGPIVSGVVASYLGFKAAFTGAAIVLALAIIAFKAITFNKPRPCSISEQG